jgi:hypothetical protein
VRLAIAAAVLVIATTADAEDDKPEIQRMRFVETDTQLTVSTLPPGGIGQLFDLKSYDALKHAPLTTVVIRILIAPQGSDEPVAQPVVLQRKVTYDAWDDKYEVHLDEPNGDKKLYVKYQSEALKWLTSIDDVPIAPLSVLPINKVFVLKMVVELNPRDKAELAEVRRHLTQGNGGGIERGGGMFGSFVMLFYHSKIDDADRILRVQSQPFYRPGP